MPGFDDTHEMTPGAKQPQRGNGPLVFLADQLRCRHVCYGQLRWRGNLPDVRALVQCFCSVRRLPKQLSVCSQLPSQCFGWRITSAHMYGHTPHLKKKKKLQKKYCTCRCLNIISVRPCHIVYNKSFHKLQKILFVIKLCC